jgi:uncharacterized protein (TIGR02246 family)
MPDGAPIAAAVLEALCGAWERADADAWSACFWPDSTFVNVLGHRFDWDANRSQHARIWATIYAGSRVQMTLVGTRALGSDYLLLIADSRAAGIKAPPPGVRTAPDGAIESRLAFVLQERAGVWRILFAQNTTYTPLPA